MKSLIDTYEELTDTNVTRSDLRLYEERIQETIDEIDYAIKIDDVTDDIKDYIKEVLFCGEYSDMSEEKAEEYEEILKG